MKYLLLIYENETERASMTPEQQGAEYAEYGAYTQALKAAGVLRGGEALKPTNTATTVRVREGKVLNTDGPFAETKEQLGGHYLLDCKDLDEAISWAAKIPAARAGSIEIRPVVELNQ